MRTVPLSQVKTHLSSLVDEVDGRDERVVITKHGRPAAVLVSNDYLEGLEETLEIMSDREFYEEIKRAIKRAESGKVRWVDLDDLDEHFERKTKTRRTRRSA